MHKAVFLDRDGVINEEVDYLRRIEDIVILEKVPESLKLLKEKNFLLIAITNQPVIARGWATEDEIERIHDEMNKIIIRKGGSPIDKFYFCPHHPNADILKYRKECDCRKPSPGLILKAGKEWKINLKESYMIGDRISDIVTGKKAGCKTILIESAISHIKIQGSDYDTNSEPDLKVKNLYEASKLIS